VGRPPASITSIRNWTLAASGAAAKAVATALAAPGLSTSSESSSMTTSPEHRSSPAFSAEAWPPFPFSTASTRPP
jgi:hypothetical protein